MLIRNFTPASQVVEMAPAYALSQEVKNSLYRDAVKLAKHVGYRNAGALVFGWSRGV